MNIHLANFVEIENLYLILENKERAGYQENI